MNKKINKKLNWFIRVLMFLGGLFFILSGKYFFGIQDDLTRFYHHRLRSADYYEFIMYILAGIYVIFVAVTGNFSLWWGDHCSSDPHRDQR